MDRQRLTACAYILGILALPAAIAISGRYWSGMPDLNVITTILQEQGQTAQSESLVNPTVSNPTLSNPRVSSQGLEQDSVQRTMRRWERAASH